MIIDNVINQIACALVALGWCVLWFALAWRHDARRDGDT